MSDNNGYSGGGTNEMRDNAANWTLANDVKLLSHLQKFSEDLLQKSSDAEKELTGLTNSVQEAFTDFNNVSNQLLSLQNTQFLENRVYDEEPAVDVPSPAAEVTEEVDSQKTSLESYKEAVAIGMQLLDSHYIQLQYVESSDSEDDTSSEPALVWRPKPRYTSVLPLLIGSAEWWADDSVGLAEFRENEEVVLSDVDSADGQLPVENQQANRVRMSTSSSSNDASTLPLDPAVDGKNFYGEENEANMPTQEGSIQKTLSADKLQEPTDFTRELAARLGSVVKNVPTSRGAIEKEIAKVDSKQKVVPTTSRASADLFGSVAHAERDLFGNSPSNLFDDDNPDDLFSTSNNKPGEYTQKSTSVSSAREPLSTKNIRNNDDLFSKNDDLFGGTSHSERRADEATSQNRQSSAKNHSAKSVIDEVDNMNSALFRKNVPKTLSLEPGKKSSSGNLFSSDESPDDDDLFSRIPKSGSIKSKTNQIKSTARESNDLFAEIEAGDKNTASPSSAKSFTNKNGSNPMVKSEPDIFSDDGDLFSTIPKPSALATSSAIYGEKKTTNSLSFTRGKDIDLFSDNLDDDLFAPSTVRKSTPNVPPNNRSSLSETRESTSEWQTSTPSTEALSTPNNSIDEGAQNISAPAQQESVVTNDSRDMGFVENETSSENSSNTINWSDPLFSSTRNIIESGYKSQSSSEAYSATVEVSQEANSNSLAVESTSGGNRAFMDRIPEHSMSKNESSKSEESESAVSQKKDDLFDDDLFSKNLHSKSVPESIIPSRSNSMQDQGAESIFSNVLPAKKDKRNDEVKSLFGEDDDDSNLFITAPSNVSMSSSHSSLFDDAATAKSTLSGIFSKASTMKSTLFENIDDDTNLFAPTKTSNQKAKPTKKNVDEDLLGTKSASNNRALIPNKNVTSAPAKSKTNPLAKSLDVASELFASTTASNDELDIDAEAGRTSDKTSGTADNFSELPPGSITETSVASSKVNELPTSEMNPSEIETSNILSSKIDSVEISKSEKSFSDTSAPERTGESLFDRDESKLRSKLVTTQVTSSSALTESNSDAGLFSHDDTQFDDLFGPKPGGLVQNSKKDDEDANLFGPKKDSNPALIGNEDSMAKGIIGTKKQKNDKSLFNSDSDEDLFLPQSRNKIKHDEIKTALPREPASDVSITKDSNNKDSSFKNSVKLQDSLFDEINPSVSRESKDSSKSKSVSFVPYVKDVNVSKRAMTTDIASSQVESSKETGNVSSLKSSFESSSSETSSERDTHSAKKSSEIGKLKLPTNLKINTAALMPGAKIPKSKSNQEIKVESDRNAVKPRPISVEVSENVQINAVGKETHPSATLQHLGRDRVKVVQKRRPQSRNARVKALRDGDGEMTEDSLSPPDPIMMIDEKEEDRAIHSEKLESHLGKSNPLGLSEEKLAAATKSSRTTDASRDIFGLNDEDNDLFSGALTCVPSMKPISKSLFGDDDDDEEDDDLFGNPTHAKSKQKIPNLDIKPSNLRDEHQSELAKTIARPQKTGSSNAVKQTSSDSQAFVDPLGLMTDD